MNKILRYALALAHVVIESVRIEDEGIVVSVRPHRRYGPALPGMRQAMRMLRRLA